MHSPEQKTSNTHCVSFGTTATSSVNKVDMHSLYLFLIDVTVCCCRKSIFVSFVIGGGHSSQKQ